MILRSVTEILSGTKVVKSRSLNRLGVQLARSIAARFLYKLRPYRANPNVLKNLNDLNKDGMLILHDFLPKSDFLRLKAECLSLINHGNEKLEVKMHGPTEYSIAMVRDFPDFPQEMIRRFYTDPRLNSLMQAAEKFRFRVDSTHRAIERVKQGATTTTGDPETELHSDIFYNTHKAWLYLTDVSKIDAPLVYVKGSHNLGVKQLPYIYKHSLRPYPPSRRITNDEMQSLGWKETILECKSNTLVIANVCGYHRRHIGAVGGERIALHCSIRIPPFALWKAL